MFNRVGGYQSKNPIGCVGDKQNYSNEKLQECENI